MSGQVTSAAVAGEPLVRLRLVPVEVFGADRERCPGCGADVDTGYGLMDAVSSWSDCNRAIGHVYRADDFEGRDEEGLAGCVTVWLTAAEAEKLKRPYGGDDPAMRGGDRCPACHVPYGNLPDGHRLDRPTCTALAPQAGAAAGE